MTNFAQTTMIFRFLAVAMLLASTVRAQAQALTDSVELRFTNPQFSVEEHAYSVDIEMRAVKPEQALFGINLRFFYDASAIDFEGISSLSPSYGVMGATPTAHRGNDESGQVLFNFPSAAGFVNTAVQLMNEGAPLSLSVAEWTKFATLNFSLAETAELNEKLCPSLIWDQKTAAVKESYLPGSGGVIITLVEKKTSTRETTKPSAVIAEHFNWERSTFAVDGPFGSPIGLSCIQGAVVSAADNGQPDPRFKLYQNYPNPFTGATVIEFDLPKAKQATLIFTDVNGRTLHLVKGDFTEGRNQVSVDRKDLQVSNSAMLFYRLESEDFISKSLRMIVSGD